MTTTSDSLPPAAEPAITTGRTWVRFGVAFIVGLLAVLAVGVAGMYAYDAAHDGRILPGVHVGSVDVSGMDRTQAVAALQEAYAGYASGDLVVHTALGDRPIAFASFDRRADIDAMIEAAMGVGRDGTPVDRGVAEVRAVLHGVVVLPMVTLDKALLAERIDAALTPLESEPLNATIAMGDKGIVTTAAAVGRSFDRTAVVAAALSAVDRTNAPSTVTVDAEVTQTPPATSDAVVAAAETSADQMIGDVTLTAGSEKWVIPADTVRGWITFPIEPNGSIAPVVDAAAVETSLADVAKKVAKAPVDSTFLLSKSGAVVGATASKDGRSLDIPNTVQAITAALDARAGGSAPAPVPAATLAVAPKLTTSQAQKAAPLMTRLGTWTTYFPIYVGNNYGANIWLPALTINGTVLAPGQTFEWWSTVGPVTAAKGYGLGGFIAGDHTEKTGALGGGMCSSSTTLFNAALRAGLQMGLRSNHTYYINRYPLGLDATVWIQGRARATVTFTNDTKYPILIRGYKIKNGNRGYVRYDIYGVPDGRTVSLSTPIVKNVRQAATKTEYVSTLPKGVRQQTEYPVNGMDVWVTRTVKNSAGAVIHKETYYSHYALWNGIIQIGTGGTSTSPTPTPTPTPTPPPSPPPPSPAPSD
jgi:vancomycin resistance protein YoaR